MPITLRAAQADDDAFLYDLYAGVRADEMAAWGWDAAQQQMFLRLQFNAQRQHYDQYPNADHRIILSDDQPVGRLLVSRLEDEIRLVDIALLPESRSRGIGGLLIQHLLDEARQAGKVVRLHVEKNNRAQRLYERLGFARIGDTGSHLFLEWQPTGKGVRHFSDADALKE